MKRSKRPAPVKQPAPSPAAAAPPWLWWAGAALVALLAWGAYSPALSGPFVFDDQYLSFQDPSTQKQPLTSVSPGLRPLLMIGYLVNYRVFGLDPYYFHLVSLLVHFANAILAGLIVRKLLEWSTEAGVRRDAIAVFAGALFLLHPLATESVSYVAGRSEAQSVLFFFAAFAAFLYGKQRAISWPGAALIFALFGAAVLTKEHAAVLPALLLLTDWFFNPPFCLSGIRRNWRLYIPIAAGSAAAGWFVWQVVRRADTAGFALKDLPWSHYLFTQFRAVWVYVRLFFAPYGQNIDHPFAISRSLLDHGAVLGLLALAAALAVALWFRRRAPLVSYGFLAFLLLLAPTSSFIPIRDPLAERRLYLPMIGLLCAVAGMIAMRRRRQATLAAVLAGVLLAAAFLTWRRNQVWTSSVALWESSVATAPANARAQFHLAFAYYEEGRCTDAVRHYELAAGQGPVEERLLADWALALDCAGRPEDALSRLSQVAPGQRSGHTWALIGMIHGKQGRRAEALDALDTALRIDPASDAAYLFRGNVRASSGEWEPAAGDYHRAVSLNPGSQLARDALDMAERNLRQKR